MMLIPFPIIFGGKFFGGSISRTKSGDKHTAKWWYDKVNNNEVSIQRFCAHLNMLANQNVVIKENNGGYDITRFKPSKNYSVNEIVEKMKKRLDK